MIDIDILTLIPQRLPFIAVSNLISCDEIKTETSFEIQKESIFVENEELSEAGIIENFAQTCAVRLGYLNKNDTVKIGMIGSIDNIEIFSLPRVNATLYTTITVSAELMNILLVESQSISAGEVKASCKMKIFLTNINVS